MKKFLLDKIPHFGAGKVTIDKTTYELTMVNDNGCHLTVTEGGMMKDQISLTKNDMKAFYVLLSAKDI